MRPGTHDIHQEKPLRDPICIAGMHRSGTSMVAHLLHLCGVYLGEETELMNGNEWNTDGYWEYLPLVKMNDTILAKLGGGWDFPPSYNKAWVNRTEIMLLREEAYKVLRLFQGSTFWGWKDPRNSITLAFWKSIFPSMKIVICVRSPLEVAHSLQQRGFNSIPFGLNLWLEYNKRLITETEPKKRIVVHYDSFFSHPKEELFRILGFLGIPSDANMLSAATTIISKSLRHYSVSQQELRDAGAANEMIELYEALCIEAGPVYQQHLIELINNGELDGPTETLVRLLRSDPTNPAAFIALGKTLFNDGDYERAMEHFKHALHVEPSNTEALRNLADLYFVGFGKLQDAYRIYLKLLDQNPKDVETILILGNIDALQDNFESAKKYYMEALLLQPGNRDAWENLSHLLKREEMKGAGKSNDNGQAFGCIDNPKSGQIVSGELNAYGWVLCKTQKNCDIVVMIDDIPVSGILRGKRQDVIAAYADYEQLNSDPGFGFVLNTCQLTNGKHNLKCVAVINGTSVPVGEISFEVLNEEVTDDTDEFQKIRKSLEIENLMQITERFLFKYKLLPKISYQEIKYSKIQLVSSIGNAESIRDFGGIWGVNGLYLLEGSKNLKCKFAEMIDITPRKEYEENIEKYKEITNCKYNMINADFRDSSIFYDLQDVEVSLLYEVILHQDNAVEVIKNVIKSTKKFVCFAQPVMKEELFCLPNACVNLQFYPEQLKDILRFAGWWEKERVVTRFDTSCWMWGQTASYIISIFQGYGWKLAHMELYHMADYWNYVMARFVPES